MKLFIMSIRCISNEELEYIQYKLLHIIDEHSIDEIVFYPSLPEKLQEYITSLCDGNRFDFFISVLEGSVFDHFLCRRQIKNADVVFFIRNNLLTYSMQWENVAKKYGTVFYVYEVHNHFTSNF